MRAPHMEFVYRLQVKVGGTVRYSMTKIHGSQISRNVAHIGSGTVKGPHVNGVIVEGSGGDWSQQVIAPKVLDFCFCRAIILLLFHG